MNGLVRCSVRLRSYIRRVMFFSGKYVAFPIYKLLDELSHLQSTQYFLNNMLYNYRSGWKIATTLTLSTHCIKMATVNFFIGMPSGEQSGTNVLLSKVKLFILATCGY